MIKAPPVMIELINLKKNYNESTALDIEQLLVSDGESLGVVGNNGAGKTTLFRLILDLIQASSGCVNIDGKAVARNEFWKSYTGAFLDEGFLIDFLTPDEFFKFIAKVNQVSAESLNDFLNLMGDFFNSEIVGSKKLIRDLSKGNQKKVGIAAAMMTKPKLLLLDEPFTALDPSSQIRLKRLLIELQERHSTTLLISSHDLNHITEVCKRIVILERGCLVKDLKTNEDTLAELEAYFTV
jgi:ABC-2 type transport system ATP-binding protein